MCSSQKSMLNSCICLYACPSVHMYVYLSTHVCLSVCLSIYLSTYLSVCLSICPHVCSRPSFICGLTFPPLQNVSVYPHCYISSHTHIHTYTYQVQTHIHIHALFMYLCMYVTKRVCVPTLLYKLAHTHTRTHTRICMYACM